MATARSADSCIASYLVRQSPFKASSIMSATASGELRVGEALERGRQAGAGLLLPPEHALHSCTGTGKPGAHRVCVFGHDR